MAAQGPSCAQPDALIAKQPCEFHRRSMAFLEKEKAMHGSRSARGPCAAIAEASSASPSAAKRAAASSAPACVAASPGCAPPTARARTGAMTLCWSLDKLGP